jgi:DNA-binding transcriptional LysR family regulator
MLGPSGETRVAVEGSFRSNSAEMLRAAAFAGAGPAIVPNWAITDALHTGALVLILPPASTVHAAYPGNRLTSFNVRAFVDHLARFIGRPPYYCERAL